MPNIAFHFRVAEPLHYACRLLRKATRQGSRVTVTAPSERLAALDRALWTFEATEFIPHVRLVAGGELPTRLRATPVCLADEPADSLHHDVLVNLGETPPRGFESFARLVEIVSLDEADRAAARSRWKHYQSRGYPIETFEVGA